MFKKLVVANRGEIACRIMRTAAAMGIRTVAVYSDADRHALHVTMADEAVRIGGAAPADSYLRIDAVMEAISLTGADAVHPGYGFLAENADFARRCTEAGVTFVGPPASAIEIMGSKSAAKRTMEAAGVPLLQGYHGEAQDPELLRQAAAEIGYPVLLKAVAGGGGKGMRQVSEESEFDDALAAARREALSSFGNDAMLVEKYLQQPRHIEIQIFTDAEGNGVYLFERDCSIQRRHQKIIEEAPAPGISEEVRSAMGEAALRAAHAVSYVGAGTVEFLYESSGKFYFMEMNTRLQVEHPVTEMITGQDLVAWQLRVADGETLPCSQDQLSITGHAIEARIYAEDPHNGFLPAAGRLAWLQAPAMSSQVRVDTGVQAGDEVGVFYDPMIAKLIVWDENRELATNRLAAALADYQIAGVTTNIAFLSRVSGSAAFRQGDISTGFIEQQGEQLFRVEDAPLATVVPLAVLYLTLAERDSSDASDPWQAADYWRPNGERRHMRSLSIADETVECTITEPGDGEFLIAFGEHQYQCHGHLDGHHLDASIGDQRLSATVIRDGNDCTIFTGALTARFSVRQPDLGEAVYLDDGSGLTAPMHGTIVDILVAPGASVEAGQTLLILEAMKMEHPIKAPAAGQVIEIFFAAGDLVDSGAELLALEVSE